MEHITISQYYLFLKNWWETLDLTNYEKNYLNEEIISFNQQLIRLKDRKIRIGVYGKAGVGKSFILNFLLNEKHFKTDIINGSTKRVEGKEWLFKHKNLKGVELLDCPGFDFCNIESPKNTYSEINNSEVILFTVAGDLNRLEVAKINSFAEIGKKIIIVLNKIENWNKLEINEIIRNIKLKLPINSKIPVLINSGKNIKNYIKNIINLHGETLLICNSFQLADDLFLKIKEQRLKRRQKEAQSAIGKFATIKASAVALNPLMLFDVAGSFALDTALISELSKIYGLSLRGESTRKIIKNVSINNLFLGATQIGINTSLNLIRKVILLAAPFTNGISLLPYGPIAVIQAAIAVRSTKIVGKLAAKEIFTRSKVTNLDPLLIIKKIVLKEPITFNHINVYLSNRNLKNNFAIFLP